MTDFLYDLNELPFTTEFFNYLDDDRPGVQWASLWILLQRIASRIIRGWGCFLCGPMECGKGTSMAINEGLFSDQIHQMYTDDMSNSGVIQYIKKYGLDDKSIACMLDDLSVVADDWKKMYDTVNVASKLIQDRKLGLTNRDVSKIKTSKKFMQLPVANVYSYYFVAGMTPELILRIQDYNAWKTAWKDRFIKFQFFITAREHRRVLNLYSNNPELEEPPIEIVKENVKAIIAKHSGLGMIPVKIFKMDDDAKEIFVIVRNKLFKKHHNIKRASRYFKGMLTAHAWLNGRDKVTMSDLAIMMLFFPNLYMARAGSNIQQMTFLTLRDGGNLVNMAKSMECRTKDLTDYFHTQNYQYGFDSNPLLLVGKQQGVRDIKKDHRKFILKEIRPGIKYHDDYPPFMNYIDWQEDLIRDSVRMHRSDADYKTWERVNGGGSLWD